MNKEAAVKKSKQLRQSLDAVLQSLKEFKAELISADGGQFEDKSESIAQCTISQRDLESAIMRQGMVLKAIGDPNPYPESLNPHSVVVAPPTDGLTL